MTENVQESVPDVSYPQLEDADLPAMSDDDFAQLASAVYLDWRSACLLAEDGKLTREELDKQRVDVELVSAEATRRFSD